MLRKHRISLIIGLAFYSSLLYGCLIKSNLQVKPINPQYYLTSTATAIESSTPFPLTSTTPTFVPPTVTPTPTITFTPSNTPLPSDTPTSAPTPVWVYLPAGDALVPILLYHRIADDSSGNFYTVSLENFRNQMEALRDWGYTSITPTYLATVLVKGGELPPRPVVITFDDGYKEVYQNAFPIMRELGFVGTNYLDVHCLGLKYCVSVEQLQQMADAGWELGSHSMSHTDLTTDHSIADYEIHQSKLALEEAVQEEVSTFAYPFGKTDEFISNKVRNYGYVAGMGVGLGVDHDLTSLYNLSRIEIQPDYDLRKFASLLPWYNR
jgi:peptidoglycan/xylan/chitin deacetylase (PgdA/CDA1 family)